MGNVATATACPSCGSDHTSSMRMAYEQGTSNMLGSGIGWGGGMSFEAVGFEGVSQSALARSVAPPAPRNESLPNIVFWFWLFIGTLPCMLVGGVVNIVHPSNSNAQLGVEITIAALLYIAGFLFFWKWRRGARRYNRNELSGRHAAWLNQWICLRCGHRFAV